MLPQILAQANTNGVQGTMYAKIFRIANSLCLQMNNRINSFVGSSSSAGSLLNEEGSLLASTGAGDHVVVAAIASNVWAQYQKLGNEDLEYMLFDCEVPSRTPIHRRDPFVLIYSSSSRSKGES